MNLQLLLAQGKLGVKTLSIENLEFFLRQLQDPQNFRPLKKRPTHPKFRINPRTRVIESIESIESIDHRPPRVSHRIPRTAGGSAFTEFGRPKASPHTKKTAVTYIPPHGCTNLYRPKGSVFLGLLFNLEACDLKNEKYIFPDMDDQVNTDKKPWLSETLLGVSSCPAGISLQELQELAAISDWHKTSELLIGLSQEALVGICFIHENEGSESFALSTQAQLEGLFKRPLPIAYFKNRQISLSMPKTSVPQPFRPGLTAEMDLTPFQERLSGKSLPHEVEALIFSYLNIKDFYILCAVSKLFKSKDSPGQINPLFREQISSLYLPARTLRDNQDVNDWKIMGILTAYNMRDLIELAHEKPSVAHAIMNSRYYLKKLPSIEHYIPQDPLDHNISPHVSRAIKLFNGLIGSLIGLLVGICFSALHVLYAAFTLPLIIMEPEKSFIRSMGGLSIFPAICTLGAISTAATMSYHSGIKSAVGKLMKIFTAFNMIFLGRPVFQDIDAPDHLSVFNQKHASFYLSKRYEGETFRELRRIEGLRSRKTVARSALCFKSPPRLNASPIGPGLASPA